MVFEAYINVIYVANPSCGITDVKSALLFCKEFIMCFCAISIATVKVIYMFTKALILHRWCMVRVRLLSAFVQTKAEISTWPVWFNDNSPWIVLANGNIFMVIGLLQMVFAIGILYTLCHIIGNLMISAKKCLRLEKLENYARAWQQGIVEFYGKKKYWNLEHKAYEENARISSPLFKGDYKEIFYLLSDWHETILEDIEAEFWEDEYPNDWFVNNIEDEDAEEEWTTYRAKDYEEHNINRFDAIWADNLKLLIKMFKIHIAHEEKLEAERIKKEEQVTREYLLKNARRIKAEREREKRKAKMQALYRKAHPIKNG